MHSARRKRGDVEFFLELLEAEVGPQRAEQWGHGRKAGQQSVNFSRILAAKRKRGIAWGSRGNLGGRDLSTFSLLTPPRYSCIRSPGSPD